MHEIQEINIQDENESKMNLLSLLLELYGLSGNSKHTQIRNGKLSCVKKMFCENIKSSYINVETFDFIYHENYYLTKESFFKEMFTETISLQYPSLEAKLIKKRNKTQYCFDKNKNEEHFSYFQESICFKTLFNVIKRHNSDYHFVLIDCILILVNYFANKLQIKENEFNRFHVSQVEDIMVNLIIYIENFIELCFDRLSNKFELISSRIFRIFEKICNEFEIYFKKIHMMTIQENILTERVFSAFLATADTLKNIKNRIEKFVKHKKDFLSAKQIEQFLKEILECLKDSKDFLFDNDKYSENLGNRDEKEPCFSPIKPENSFYNKKFVNKIVFNEQVNMRNSIILDSLNYLDAKTSNITSNHKQKDNIYIKNPEDKPNLQGFVSISTGKENISRNRKSRTKEIHEDFIFAKYNPNSKNSLRKNVTQSSLPNIPNEKKSQIPCLFLSIESLKILGSSTFPMQFDLIYCDKEKTNRKTFIFKRNTNLYLDVLILKLIKLFGFYLDINIVDYDIIPFSIEEGIVEIVDKINISDEIYKFQYSQFSIDQQNNHFSAKKNRCHQKSDSNLCEYNLQDNRFEISQSLQKASSDLNINRNFLYENRKYVISHNPFLRISDHEADFKNQNKTRWHLIRNNSSEKLKTNSPDQKCDIKVNSTISSHNLYKIKNENVVDAETLLSKDLYEKFSDLKFDNLQKIGFKDTYQEIFQNRVQMAISDKNLTKLENNKCIDDFYTNFDRKSSNEKFILKSKSLDCSYILNFPLFKKNSFLYKNKESDLLLHNKNVNCFLAKNYLIEATGDEKSFKRTYATAFIRTPKSKNKSAISTKISSNSLSKINSNELKNTSSNSCSHSYKSSKQKKEGASTIYNNFINEPKFMDSLAFHILASYLLGIGDRTENNCGISKDKIFFQYDFSYICGSNPMHIKSRIFIPKFIRYEILSNIVYKNTLILKILEMFKKVRLNFKFIQNDIFTILNKVKKTLNNLNKDIRKVKKSNSSFLQKDLQNNQKIDNTDYLFLSKKSNINDLEISKKKFYNSNSFMKNYKNKHNRSITKINKPITPTYNKFWGYFDFYKNNNLTSEENKLPISSFNSNKSGYFDFNNGNFETLLTSHLSNINEHIPSIARKTFNFFSSSYNKKPLNFLNVNEKSKDDFDDKADHRPHYSFDHCFRGLKNLSMGERNKIADFDEIVSKIPSFFSKQCLLDLNDEQIHLYIENTILKEVFDLKTSLSNTFTTLGSYVRL